MYVAASPRQAIARKYDYPGFRSEGGQDSYLHVSVPQVQVFNGLDELATYKCKRDEAETASKPVYMNFVNKRGASSNEH